MAKPIVPIQRDRTASYLGNQRMRGVQNPRWRELNAQGHFKSDRATMSDLYSFLFAIVGFLSLVYFFLKMANPESPIPRRRRSRPAALRPEYTMKPLAHRMGHRLVNPQARSPLFNMLPREVRGLIWEAALTRYSDPSSRFPRNKRFWRPERRGAMRIDTQLLSTCRAIYLEAYDLPVTINAVVDFEGSPAEFPPRICYGAEMLNRLALWQFCAIQSYDLTFQQRQLEQSWLGSKAFMLRADEANAEEILKDMRRYWRPSENFTWPAVREQDDLMATEGINVTKRLTHLTLRLNRTNWWTWSEAPNHPDHLGLDPGIGNGNIDERCTAKRMLEEAEARRCGTWQGYVQQNCWGKDVGLFKNLRTFDLVLETFAAKKDQLEMVVECAKTWTFPRDEHHELRFESVVSANWVGVGGYDYEDEAPWLARGAMGAQRRDAKGGLPPDPHRFEVRVVRYTVRHTIKD